MDYRLGLLFSLLIAFAGCTPPNTLPTITEITDQGFMQNTLANSEVSSQVTFSITDQEDSADKLTVIASSSSPIISIPNETTPTCNATGECSLEFFVKRDKAETAELNITVKDTRGGKITTKFFVQVEPRQLVLAGAGDEQDLIKMMADAALGDVIGFDLSGVTTPYTLPLAGEINISKAISLQGPGADKLILDSEGLHRHFRIQPGINFGLHDLHLSNGQAQDDGSTVYDDPIGGAIFNEGVLELSSTIFTRNSAINGGAVYNFGAAAITTVRDSTFGGNTQTANRAQRSGAALFNDGGRIFVFDSSFSFNQAVERGGVAYNLGKNARLVIDNSQLVSNLAKDGGALKNELGFVRLQNNTMLENNTATLVEGGGLFNTNGTIEMIDSSFIGNRALEGTGGALYSFGSNASLLLEHSIIRGNSAVTAGGLAHEDGSKILTIQKASIIEENEATGSAGGIYNGGKLIISSDSVVRNNRADVDNKGTGIGGGILNLGAGDISGVVAGTVLNNVPDDIADITP